MITIRPTSIVMVLALLTGCATHSLPGNRAESHASMSSPPVRFATHSQKSCTPPTDWEDGEKWAREATVGTGTTSIVSAERRFRAEKGGQSYQSFYDGSGNCTFTSDVNSRSRR